MPDTPLAKALVIAAALLSVARETPPTAAGETLIEIKSRGTGRCGVKVCQLAVSAVYVLALFHLARREPNS